MKSTIKVSISGIAFTIDEDAYRLLKNYLDELNAHFSLREGGKETVEDIESRLAELLLSRMSTSEQSVNMTDVTEVVAIMGKPEELGDGEQPSVSGGMPTSIPASAKKRLYRDPDHKVIAGVCGGLGSYFNIDPIFIRLLFAALTFSSPFVSLPQFGSIVVVLYILLWICLPKALTMAQKLEMRGESPSVANIERKMREDALYQSGGGNTKSGSSFIRSLFKVVLITLGIICAIPIICVGIALLVALVFGIFMGGWVLQDGDLSMLNMVSLPHINLTLAKILAFIVLFIPLLLLIYSGLRMMFRFKSKAKGVVASSVIVWLVCVLVLAGMTGYSLKNYRSEAKVVTELAPIIPSDTVYVRIPAGFDMQHSQLSLNVPDNDNNAIPLLWKSPAADSLFVFPRIRVHQVTDSVGFSIKLIRESNARNKQEARQKVESIAIPYSVSDSLITVSPAAFTLNQKWSGERSRIVIYVPESKTLVVDKWLEEGRSNGRGSWDE